ncbi:MAG: GntR family transcriptional regulator [Piscinibacter sp.]
MSEQLASSIERWIADEQMAEGTPLPERMIGERFRVSRTPVREALLRLAEQGTITTRPDGGYAVRARIELPPLASFPDALLSDPDEPVYLQIAEDRLSGVLPERTTENELMRRYGLTRPRLSAVLRRIANEGWIERLPGKGWEFQPVLSSGTAYDQGYRLRILMEPAAIMEPTWRLDDGLLRKCRAEQQALVDGAVEWASPAQLFDANSRLHEAIAGFSGNVFICDALRRVNRLRRLMEYRKVVDREGSARRCKEHLTLIDLLLTGQREAAADFMRLHLRDAAREKAGKSAAVSVAERSGK